MEDEGPKMRVKQEIYFVDFEGLIIIIRKYVFFLSSFFFFASEFYGSSACYQSQ